MAASKTAGPSRPAAQRLRRLSRDALDRRTAEIFSKDWGSRLALPSPRPRPRKPALRWRGEVERAWPEEIWLASDPEAQPAASRKNPPS